MNSEKCRNAMRESPYHAEHNEASDVKHSLLLLLEWLMQRVDNQCFSCHPDKGGVTYTTATSGYIRASFLRQEDKKLMFAFLNLFPKLLSKSQHLKRNKNQNLCCIEGNPIPTNYQNPQHCTNPRKIVPLPIPNYKETRA